MIVRGHDIQFSVKGEVVHKDAEEVTLQFRKTKSDQQGFGTCRTLLRTGVEHVCVVEALQELRKTVSRRFGVEKDIYPFSGGHLARC